MKLLDGYYYLEVKNHRYRIDQAENEILRYRDLPISLRTQYQVQNEIRIRKNQKVIKNDNDELETKNYPKIKQPNNRLSKLKPPKLSFLQTK